MPTPLPMTSADLLNELSLHRQLVATQQTQIESLKQEVEQLKQHNEVLRLKVDAMARKLFGRSSEKLDPAQLQMVFEALQNGVPEEDFQKNRKPPQTPFVARRPMNRPKGKRLARSAAWSRSSKACK